MRPLHTSRSFVSLVLAVILAAALTITAGAITQPGTNGLIVADGSPLLVVDPSTGSQSVLPGSVDADDEPEANPSGTKVVFENNGQILLADFPSGNNRTQVTAAGGFGQPSWSPDGATIVFSCPSGLCTVPSGGPFPAQPVTLSGTQLGDDDPQYTQDGASIVFDNQSGKPPGVFRVSSQGGGRTFVLGTDGGDEPTNSTDGTALFFDTLSGIFSVPFPNGGNPQLINGTQPGDDSAFPSPDGTLVGFDNGQALFTVSAAGQGGRAAISGGTGAHTAHWTITPPTTPPATTPPATTPPVTTPPPTTPPAPGPGTGTVTGTVVQSGGGSGLFGGGFGSFGALLGFGAGPLSPLFGLFGTGFGLTTPAQEPVAGAVVSASTGQTDTTGADGGYTLGDVPAGQTTVTATIQSQSFSLFGAGSSTTNCTDPETGSARVRVTVPEGDTVIQDFRCPDAGGGFFGLPLFSFFG